MRASKALQQGDLGKAYKTEGNNEKVLVAKEAYSGQNVRALRGTE